MLKTIIIIFFVINAIFWSLFPHNIHCNVIKMFINSCPSHSVHLTIGVVSFNIALVLAQYDYIKTLF